MTSYQDSSRGAQPPPADHTLHQRNVSDKPVTLCHRRLAHDGAPSANPCSPGPKAAIEVSVSRCNSSSSSRETGQSDPQEWFDYSNQHPTVAIDNDTMDVDLPFPQRGSDSSNSETPCSHKQYNLSPGGLSPEDLSSADGYRSIIDDLTVEIQQLKEELKRYKQTGPDRLRRDTLFETRVHSLHEQKKIELEDTLRSFAASLDGSPEAASLRRRQRGSRSGIRPSHGSSALGPNLRPVDSADASMPSAAMTSSTFLGRPTMSSVESSTQYIDGFLRDTPDGLYPRDMVMTDKERKNLVVRRLEQLFTGSASGPVTLKKPPMQPGGSSVPASVVADAQATDPSTAYEPLSLGSEPAREAVILTLEQRSRLSGSRSGSEGHGSASDPKEDHAENGGRGNDSTAPGANPSLPAPPLPEQRPTRPRDLDPDRAQIPSENMNYIRHLGLLTPGLQPGQRSTQDNRPDAGGWVHLSLLCNMAQIHILSVTPNFIRSAVSEISTRFQLSPDGRKVRWRGGSQGTEFNTDCSGRNSHKGPCTDDLDGSDKKRRRLDAVHSTVDELQSDGSGKDTPKFAPQLRSTLDSFQYKPLLVQQDTPDGHSSLDEMACTGSDPEESGRGPSCSRGPTRKKQHREGVVIYYSGALFYTDLSGDPSDGSTTAHTLLSARKPEDSQQSSGFPTSPRQTTSGLSINHRPLTYRGHVPQQSSAVDGDHDEARSLASDDCEQMSDIELDLVWSDHHQYLEQQPLEPCGLGGVLPEDHFMVVVVTKRPTQDVPRLASGPRSGRLAGSVKQAIHQLATMPTSCPVLGDLKRKQGEEEPPPIEVEYLSGRIKRLAPAPLPPPITFFPPFSTDISTSGQNDDVSLDVDDAPS
ncbi:hypothetical protein ACJ41O_001569 [Fusarium nematophilum]